MIDLSEESVEENISTSAKYLKRAAPMKQCVISSRGGSIQNVPPFSSNVSCKAGTNNWVDGWRWRLESPAAKVGSQRSGQLLAGKKNND